MVAVPAATPVTTPVVGFTVATVVDELLQVPPLTVEANVVVEPIHTDWVPERLPAEATFVIVTCAVVVALEHPPDPATVYVIVVVPAETPVTTPEVLLMVATEVAELLQVPPLTLPVKLMSPVK